MLNLQSVGNTADEKLASNYNIGWKVYFYLFSLITRHVENNLQELFNHHSNMCNIWNYQIIVAIRQLHWTYMRNNIFQIAVHFRWRIGYNKWETLSKAGWRYAFSLIGLDSLGVLASFPCLISIRPVCSLSVFWYSIIGSVKAKGLIEFVSHF